MNLLFIYYLILVLFKKKFVQPVLFKEPDGQRASVIRATTDSPMSPPPLASIAAPLSRSTSNRSSGIYSTHRSLYDILSVSQEKTKTRPDFCGRSNDQPITKLYQNLVLETERGSRGENMEVE